MEHQLERKILLKLIHSPELSYNEVWNKEGDSSTFAYHLGKLDAKGLITKKENGKYSLTEEGKKLSAYVEGDSGKKALFPTLIVLLLAKQGNKYLCQQRLKEPFYGVWGFPAGKINFGQNIFECASRDLKEETGLETAKEHWKLKALEQVKTYDENSKELLYHHYIYHVETETVSGELKEKTHKGKNEWITIEEYKKRDIFPSDKFFDHIFPAKKKKMMECERYMKKGKFTGMKTISVVKF